MFNTNKAVDFAILLLLLSAIILPFWQSALGGATINWTAIGISQTAMSGILLIVFVLMILKGGKGKQA